MAATNVDRRTRRQRGQSSRADDEQTTEKRTGRVAARSFEGATRLGDRLECPDDRPAHLEFSIGRKVRLLRQRLQITAMELATEAGLSPGMLSKIENGVTSPSLATLQALARALNVPITSLFADFEERRDCSYVRAGQGVLIERRGTKPATATSFSATRSPANRRRAVPDHA